MPTLLAVSLVELMITCCSVVRLAALSGAEDKATLWSFIRRYAPEAAPETHADLDAAAGYAVAYYNDKVNSFDREVLSKLCDFTFPFVCDFQRHTNRQILHAALYDFRFRPNDKFHFCFECPSLKEERDLLLKTLAPSDSNEEEIGLDNNKLFNLLVGKSCHLTNPVATYSALYVLWKKRCLLLNCSPGVNAAKARRNALST